MVGVSTGDAETGAGGMTVEVCSAGTADGTGDAGGEFGPSKLGNSLAGASATAPRWLKSGVVSVPLSATGDGDAGVSGSGGFGGGIDGASEAGAADGAGTVRCAPQWGQATTIPADGAIRRPRQLPHATSMAMDDSETIKCQVNRCQFRRTSVFVPMPQWSRWTTG